MIHIIITIVIVIVFIIIIITIRNHYHHHLHHHHAVLDLLTKGLLAWRWSASPHKASLITLTHHHRHHHHHHHHLPDHRHHHHHHHVYDGFELRPLKGPGRGHPWAWGSLRLGPNPPRPAPRPPLFPHPKHHTPKKTEH